MKNEKTSPCQLQIDAFIKKLSLLTCVTKKDFESLYVMAVVELANYLEIKNPDHTAETFAENLNVIINALKRRRGFLLPGGDSEVSFREREEWTYAVFSAALLKPIEYSKRLEVATHILPRSALAWLQRNSFLFELWRAYLLEEQKTILSEIIEETDKTKPALFNSETENNPIKKNSEKNTIGAAQPNDEMFWEWLKQVVIARQISINQDDSLVHGTEQGIFIRVPETIEAFLLQMQMAETPLKQRIALTKAVKKNPLLVRSGKGSRLHSYCLDNWGSRKTISGIIAPTSMLFVTGVVPLNKNLLLA